MGKDKIVKKIRRKNRVGSKLFGTAKKPRVSVGRSNKKLFVQFIDDEKGATLFAKNSNQLKRSNKDTKLTVAEKMGEELAKVATKKKIKHIVFDRGPNKYHGRVRSLAEGLRKGGLKF